MDDGKEYGYLVKHEIFNTLKYLYQGNKTELLTQNNKKSQEVIRDFTEDKLK